MYILYIHIYRFVYMCICIYIQGRVDEESGSFMTCILLQHGGEGKRKEKRGLYTSVAKTMYGFICIYIHTYIHICVCVCVNIV